AQRLVRKICEHCRQKVQYSDTLLQESALPLEYRDHEFYEGQGCIECNGTGFHGRLAIAELLDLSDKIRGLILEKRPAAEIKKAAAEEGMLFLREAAVKKVLEGVTTLREVNKVTFVD
ncbi:MAG TPA: pilus assembly protein PilB, partial [Thermoanaerobaculia bacterium]|nr:pilus assembly protein PilB [Thermoanaerobaculia bacterium]